MTEREIFLSAMEIEDPVERSAHLQEACGGDAGLQGRVEALIASHESQSRFLNTPVVEQMSGAPTLADDAAQVSDSPRGANAVSLEYNGPDTLIEDCGDMSDEIPLGYLEPSSKEGSLGRLAHYEIEEVLGRGAFGTVLKAFDEKLHRVVAIKVLSPEMAATSPARKRFIREARSSAQIRHEHVVAIYGVEEEPIPYLVMEYIPGQTLQQRLDGQGPLEVIDVLRLGKQMADGLAAAHAEDLIHRDIKPGNILLDTSVADRVKITDFGLARTADDASMTQSGMIAGTPMYMAPEQAHGKQLDQRADLFSFGSVLYQMLSGRPPFRAPSTMAVLKRVTEDAPRPIQEVIPEVPGWMCEIVGHLHAKNPDERYSSATEVSELLARCLADVEAGRKPKIPVPAERAQESPETVRPRKSRPALQRPLVRVAAVVLVLFAGLAITEATGVTELASTLNRIAMGEGTLIVEVDDPGLSVTVARNGEELTVSDGTYHMFTLRPGQREVVVSRDGEMLSHQLVTITRNERTVVRLSPETDLSLATPVDVAPDSFADYALTFDNRDDRIDLPTFVNQLGDGPFTIEAWVTIGPGELPEDQRITVFRDKSGMYAHLQLHKTWRFWRATGATGPGYLSDQSPVPGIPTHVAAVWDGSQGILYVNGQRQSVSSAHVDSLVFDATTPSWIGGVGRPETLETFIPYTIDELRVSGVARYSEDFTPATRHEVDEHTSALYHFDEGSGDQLTDASGNGHHGAIIGAEWIHPDGSSIDGESMYGSESIDLISLFEPTRDFLDERMKVENGKIVTPRLNSAPGAIALIPYDPVPADYDIELQLQRISTRGAGFNFGILVDGHQVAVGMDCGLNLKVWGLDFLDGEPAHVPGNATHNPGSRLLVGETSDVTIQVRNNHVTAVCDGEILVDWTGDPERLSVWPGLNLPTSDSLFFVAQSEFIVHKMTLIPRGVPTSRDSSGWHGWSADAPPPAIAPFDADQAAQHQQAWADHLGVPVEFENSIGMKFRLIPPGEFLMGSTPEEIEAALMVVEDPIWIEQIKGEAPQHMVVLTQPMYVGVTEVTQTQYERVMGTNPSSFSASGESQEAVADLETDHHPVEMVSWIDSAEFCTKLSQREDMRPFDFQAGESMTSHDRTGYRLPSEAEWEFACRAGTETKYWIGDRDEELAQAGWFLGNSGGQIHDVGELMANPFGLFDMHGNVFEWVQDGWEPASYAEFAEKPAMNPTFHAGSERVFRGGAFGAFASDCRSSDRKVHRPATRSQGIGFRVVLPVDAVLDAMEFPATETNSAAMNEFQWPTDTPPPAIAPFDAEQAARHQQAWADHLGVPVEYENTIGMKFRLVPPGEFLMGSTSEEIEAALSKVGDNTGWQNWIKSEAPLHKVVLTQPIYLAITEVTQADYERLIGQNPSAYAPTGMQREAVAGIETANQPVETVSWNDAAEFCITLSQREALKSFYLRVGEAISTSDGNGYRLPSEAEWEFACRAGTAAKYWTGDRDEDLVQAAWFLGNSGGRTHAVGELEANPFGLYDMHGNVFEWVEDGWEPTFYTDIVERPAINPIGDSSSGRVFRGGSSGAAAHDCRSSKRSAYGPVTHDGGIGFRVVLPVDAVLNAMESPVSETPSAAASEFQWPAETPSPAIAPFDADQAAEHQQAWANHLDVPLEYENSVGMAFRLIPPCDFMMGSALKVAETDLQIHGTGQGWRERIKSDAPQHRVILTQPVYVGVTEVTQTQYELIMGTSPSHFSARGAGQAVVLDLETGDHPVESVSWNDAAEFCARLSRQEEMQPFYSRSGETVTPQEGTGYRLPTEAEWEHACRAGTTTQFWSGDQDSDLVRAGWFGSSSGDRTHTVAERNSNPYGLSDMHGNGSRTAGTRRSTTPSLKLLRSIRTARFPPIPSRWFVAAIGAPIQPTAVRRLATFLIRRPVPSISVFVWCCRWMRLRDL